jgi:hypothetical protein
MRLAVIHLSDIHIRTSGNPIVQVVEPLVNAANSVDASISLFLVVVSGDIGYSGEPAEYGIAQHFFDEFHKRLRNLRPDTTIEYVSVPGNHDCLLPKDQETLRATLIQGVLPSMLEAKQDAALLAALLKAQTSYNEFRTRLNRGRPKWNGICETVVIDHNGKRIQINLYNTALLSQRNEQQGKLFLPIKTIEDQILLANHTALSISVFHHSYLWLESNVAVAFRTHIERTSDIALTGHQHYSHDFYKENSTGERVLYVEAPALQDDKYPKTSAFRVLLIDWDSEKEKVISFRRADDQQINRARSMNWRFSKTGNTPPLCCIAFKGRTTADSPLPR